MVKDLKFDCNEDQHLKQSSFTPRYSMTDIFHREDERLKTFVCWPLKWVDKRELAMTGMFYSGDYDKTKCYFCEVEIWNWALTDQPLTEHLRWSPNCALLRRYCTNNIPNNWNALNQLLPPPSYDTCGLIDEGEIRYDNFSNIPQYNMEMKKDNIARSNHITNYEDQVIEIPITFVESSNTMMQNAEISSSIINVAKYFFIYHFLLFILFVILFVLEYILFTEIRK